MISLHAMLVEAGNEIVDHLVLFWISCCYLDRLGAEELNLFRYFLFRYCLPFQFVSTYIENLGHFGLLAHVYLIAGIHCY
jgi:hypothetical protein